MDCGVGMDLHVLEKKKKKKNTMNKWKRTNRSYDPTEAGRSSACWKFWRHFLCRGGYYPVVVAPIITAGFILSVYSSAGCEFIDITVGFTPNNAALNESQVDLGLFFHYDDSSIGESNQYKDLFHRGCVWYDDVFDEMIITKDRTWKVARIIATVAAAAGLLAVVTIWLLMLCPLPVGCLWPAILLPSTMLSFISEGSKFLLLDIALCRNAVWFPSGVDSLPERAENCTLGSSGFIGVAAGSAYLVALLFVCLHSPEKRDLDPNYGVEFVSPEPEFIDAESTEQAEFENQNLVEMDPSQYSADPSPSSTRVDTNGTSIGSLTPDTPDYSYQNSGPPPPPPPNDAYPIKPPSISSSPIRTMEPDDKPCTAHVSESRMAVMSKMRLSAPGPDSQDILAQLCSDLDSTLAPSGSSLGK